MAIKLLFLLLLALGHSTALAASPLLIKSGTIIDGTGGPPFQGDILIQDGRIERIERASGALSPPPGARIVDASGKFVLPGLIDSHVHYHDWSGELYLYHGVTTVADLGNSTEWSIALREGIEKGKIAGPRQFVSGAQVDAPRPGAFARPQLIAIKDPRNAAEEVRKLIAKGVDVVKVYENLTPGMVESIVGAARAAGKPVIGHTNDAVEAARLGYKGIEHTNGVAMATFKGKLDPAKLPFPGYGRIVHSFMDESRLPEVLQVLLDHGVYLNPTLRLWSWPHLDQKKGFLEEDYALLFHNTALAYIPIDYRLAILNEYFHLSRSYRVDELKPDDKELVRRGYRNAQKIVKQFVDKGGKIYAGTDSANIGTPGLALHQEMELLVDCGLTPMQALLSATRWSAEVLNQDKKLGTLEPGKFGDVLVLEANPLSDIRNTRKIAHVFKEGMEIARGFTAYHSPIIYRNIPEDSGHLNPSPLLTAMTPEAVTEGSGDVVLTLRGLGFLPWSKAHYLGTTIATEYVSDTELKATLPARLLKLVGTFPVVVENPRPVGTVNLRAGSAFSIFGTRGAESNPFYLIVKFK
ncbi:MAG: amidohydrolase family protein [Acidobacteria bacterium]|nr:amidohydrolase family protein [Acidobacteriota bacterium]